MFSFHKPKVYRSPTGCCICKAKSSSSRFTDSKKYEDDFIECFQLEERRHGEICNACVLLVKRWKKLPSGSNRNWRHVVDARAGPGIKSLTKFKSKNKKKPKDNLEKIEKILKKKHVYLKPDRYREQSPNMSDDLAEEYLANADSKGSSRSGSPAGSDDAPVSDSKRLNNVKSTLGEDDDVALHGWIDLTYFKREVVCCGTIFKGPYGEVIIDPSLIKPCLGCRTRQRLQREARENTLLESASTSPAHSSASSSPAHSVESSSSSTGSEVTKPTGKTFSDSSSDSGYDESSNPGIAETKITKILVTASIEDRGTKVKEEKSLIKSIPVVKNVVQSKAIVLTETVRLKNDLPIKLVPVNQVDKLICKPMSLAIAQNANLTLTDCNSRPIVNPIPNNPLVDFAIHASSRQSITN
ncbi:SIN3-HDAC complex-associated factor [Venturia canescens]|uniref:SIN3-HDAC complex-associated factor n=1 Tax=Venturia canescens TaxID=32260 RepID=UPI001C9C1D36|nr:SIN3-HDAC complex-associated factor [Venturia canescens]XP_043286658.1 SIN3-HDAC complex-associated factor [Venturia canescens]XP_043286659.1 SIN3-HDAC complex-associated factor [Venturia canescens]XP_043286660.1 SIN3-HDAC complex-associated factor [Venturia canescens]